MEKVVEEGYTTKPKEIDVVDLRIRREENEKLERSEYKPVKISDRMDF